MITLDVQRPSASRWRQPFTDLRGTQEPSDWLRQVAHMRVFAFDRIRQFLTRLALTAVIAAAFALLPEVSVWAWALLTLGLVQGVLEVALEPYVRFDAVTKLPLVVEGLKPLRAWWVNVYGRLPFNATGILGAGAVIANLVAVNFGTRADDSTGWVKVAALAAAVLYANSGSSGPLLEATSYEDNIAGTVLRRLRPIYWPGLAAFAVGLVLWSRATGDWPAQAVPYAFMACALVYVLGLRIREHDRLATAAGILVTNATGQAGRRIGDELHRIVSPLTKGPLDRILRSEAIDPLDRRALRMFTDFIGRAHKEARRSRGFDLGNSLLPDLASLIAYDCAVQGVDPTIDIDVPGIDGDADAPASGDGAEGADPQAVSEETAWFAKQLITTLVQNAVQAYARANAPERLLAVAAFLDGKYVVVRVADSLAPIPDEVWNRPNTTLNNFRRSLEDRGGSLSQEVLGTEGKVIEARWVNGLRPLLDMNWDENTDTDTDWED